MDDRGRLEAIKAAGLNHVRIPVPYFMFAEAMGPNAPYLTLNRFAKLKEGVMMAKKYDLKCGLISQCSCSQNGFDNSGRSGPINWANNPAYFTQTQYAFQPSRHRITQDAYAGVVTAIQAVNEPKANVVPAVQELLNKYYPWLVTRWPCPMDGTSTPTCSSPSTTFPGLQYWQKLLDRSSSSPVFSSTLTRTLSTRTGSTRPPTRSDCNRPASSSTASPSRSSTTLRLQESGTSTDPTVTVLRTVICPWDRSSSPPVPAYPYSVKYMAFMARNFKTQHSSLSRVVDGFSGVGVTTTTRIGRTRPLQYGWIPMDLDQQPFGPNPCACIPGLIQAAQNGTAEES